MSWELEMATQRMEEQLRWAAEERLARQARKERGPRKPRRGLRIEIHVSWDVKPEPQPSAAEEPCDDLVA